ncbi:MAG: GtrA family protein [Eubacterium sp.]|nr:GtrA family protein [Eubacterium sp.]
MNWQHLKKNTFFKFIGVGVINTIVGTAIMFGAYNLLHWNYWISSALNYIVGGIISFFLNKNFTFKYDGDNAKAALRFIINITICYLIAYGLAKPAVYKLLSHSTKSVQENGAMVLGMGLYVLLNYFGQRFFAFKSSN